MRASTTVERPEAAEIALARAVLYRLLACAFREPDPGWEPEWEAARRGVSAALETLEASGERLPRLCDGFDALSGPRKAEELLVEHARVFGHTPRAGATPYETEWSECAGELRQVHLLSDLAGFYRAFGLEREAASGERHDHLAVELAFLNFLCAKEAYALLHGAEEGAELVRAAQASFLREHLCRWATAFGRRLARSGIDGFYARAQELLEAWLERELRRFELEPSALPEELPPTGTSLEDCCTSCTLAPSCGEGGGAARPAWRAAREDGGAP
jgi:DMSO reductase family type II enzyme chaperone